MKDGQWFQAIDQKYLLPLFSNSVASRKHEERKSARLAARDAATRSELDLGGAAGDTNVASSGVRRNLFLVEEDGDPDLYPAERDAVVVDEDDEDDEEEEDGATAVFDGTSFASATRSTSGANTPTRRTFSHDNGSPL